MLILGSYDGFAQTITEKTRIYALEFIKNRNFNDTSLNNEKFFFIKQIDSQKFKKNFIKIYVFGPSVSDIGRIRTDFILVERVNEDGSSDFSILGKENEEDDLARMKSFFFSYNFSKDTELECYRWLILMSDHIGLKLNEKSFFSEHR